MTATKPLYLQIRDQVRERIRAGVYPLGGLLPTENELAEEFGTTRLTVRNAMDGLEQDGTVRRIQGKGSFVGLTMNTGGEVPLGFRERTRDQHANASVRILRSTVRDAGPYYARMFGIKPEAGLLSLRRLNSKDGVPVILEEVVVPLGLFPGIEDVDFSVFSLYAYYRLHGHAVEQAYEDLDVIALSARDARLLGQAEGDPALFVDSKSYDANGLLIENAIGYCVGSEGVYPVYN